MEVRLAGDTICLPINTNKCQMLSLRDGWSEFVSICPTLYFLLCVAKRVSQGINANLAGLDIYTV